MSRYTNRSIIKQTATKLEKISAYIKMLPRNCNNFRNHNINQIYYTNDFLREESEKYIKFVSEQEDTKIYLKSGQYNIHGDYVNLPEDGDFYEGLANAMKINKMKYKNWWEIKGSVNKTSATETENIISDITKTYNILVKDCYEDIRYHFSQWDNNSR